VFQKKKKNKQKKQLPGVERIGLSAQGSTFDSSGYQAS
jgi:hypothetical protein